MASKKISLLMALSFGLFLANCSGQKDETDEEGGNGSSQTSAGSLYLGMGYDVIKSSYVNRSDVIRAFPVLDQERMTGDNLIASEPMPGKQEFMTFVGASRKEFYENRNETINLGLSASVPYAGVLFSGNLGAEFGISQSDSRIFTSKYLRGRSYRYTQDEYIKSPAVEKLAEYLTESFAADLNSKNAAQIIDRYGTHVLIQYNKGGAMEFNYAYHGSELTSNTELSNALRASLSANIASFSLGVSSEYKGQEQILQKKLESDYTFNSLVYGGAPIPALGLSQIENNYETWLNSIANNADICGIDGFNKSFIPIWELAAASGNQSLAAELESEFNRRVEEQKLALADKCPATEEKEFTVDGSKEYDIKSCFPATVEIYALGAGGGGQGGHYKQQWTFSPNFTGTGGAGGGGAATYIKFEVQQKTEFEISVGKGGNGGNGYSGTWTQTDWTSGDKGENGGPSTVSWGNNTITALGGTGGGGSGDILTGGSGGIANTAWPMDYLDKLSGSGLSGNSGSKDSDIVSEGGKAGTINIGYLNSFGGGLGALRSPSRQADWGGGGAGGYDSSMRGTDGGDGRVIIVITRPEHLDIPSN